MPDIYLPNGQLFNSSLRTCTFLVAIDGYDSLTQFGFQEARGLSEEIQQSKVPEPGRFQPHTFPQQTDGRVITLIRVLDAEDVLSEWIRSVKDWQPGEADYRKSFSIYLMNEAFGISSAVRGWDIFGAWPVGWSGPELSSTIDRLAFETVTLYCEAVQEAPLSPASLITT